MTEDKDPTYQPPKGISSRLERVGKAVTERVQARRASRAREIKPNTRGKREAPGNKQLNRGELRLENFDWDSFEVTDLLGEGRCGTVFEGTLRGERVN
jgi:hypothetical protein